MQIFISPLNQEKNYHIDVDDDIDEDLVAKKSDNQSSLHSVLLTEMNAAVAGQQLRLLLVVLQILSRFQLIKGKSDTIYSYFSDVCCNFFC